MVEVIAYFRALGKKPRAVAVPDKIELHSNRNTGQDCASMYAADLTANCVDSTKGERIDLASLAG